MIGYTLVISILRLVLIGVIMSLTILPGNRIRKLFSKISSYLEKELTRIYFFLGASYGYCYTEFNNQFFISYLTTIVLIILYIVISKKIGWPVFRAKD